MSQAPDPLARTPVARRGSGEHTRQRILAAAERRFAERGFDGARLEDIAADVGVRRAAIFYHFADKRELYTEMLREAFGAFEPELPTAGPAGERLANALGAWIEFIGRRPTVARLILREAADAKPGEASGLAAIAGPLVGWFRDLAAEGASAGELRSKSDPELFISLMGAATVFHMTAMPSLTPGASLDPPTRAQLDRLEREILRVAHLILGLREPSPAAGAIDRSALEPIAH